MQQSNSKTDTVRTFGMLTVYACPGVLTRHVEWVASHVLGSVTSFDWHPQSMIPGSFQTSFEWHSAVGTAAKMASGLHGWKQLRFEVTEHQTAESSGGRWVHTPSLGIFHTQTDAAGNFVLTENRVASIITEASGDPTVFAREIRLALGIAWDEELEVFRASFEDDANLVAPRYLDRVRTS